MVSPTRVRTVESQGPLVNQVAEDVGLVMSTRTCWATLDAGVADPSSDPVENGLRAE